MKLVKPFSSFGMSYNSVFQFLLESNKIERINKVSEQEITAALHFLNLEELSIEDVEKFVSITAPTAVLRDKLGSDVMVGDYLPPRGNPRIRLLLSTLLEQINTGELDAFHAHIHYEYLHPFTDGNGRSGRLIWLWQMKDAPLGFLHTFYYQTLRERRWSTLSSPRR